MNDLSLDDLFRRLIDSRQLMRLIDAARCEDLGAHGDVTSQLTIDPDAAGSARVVARQAGVLCGGKLMGLIAKRYDQLLEVRLSRRDGDSVGVGDAVAVIAGPMRSLLAAERVVLNFTGCLSGIATTTRRYVAATEGTPARVYDTRKTVPGLRHLAKYAVRCGGGCCHRAGLHDAVLIKDNHLAGWVGEALAERLASVVTQARQLAHVKFVEVEIDAIGQLDAALGAGVDVVLLDNMTPAQLAEAVARRDKQAPGVQLEASGGITLANVRDVAATGVDRIAIGALTHSAPALDFGLDIGDG